LKETCPGDTGVEVNADEHPRRESIIKELIPEKIIFFLILNITVNLFRNYTLSVKDMVGGTRVELVTSAMSTQA
jgi:hypothetical protein